MSPIERDIEDVLKHYPGLVYREHDKRLEGSIDLVDSTTAELIDTFSVVIIIRKEFPYRFPKVIETSLKIERILDRHVYPKDNSLCFAVRAEELIKCKNGITILWFIDKVLVPRLAEEYLVNHGSKYSHEFSHGPNGDLEYYAELLKCTDHKMILYLLEWISKNSLPRGSTGCICGSHLRFKHCHQSSFCELKKLPQEFLKQQVADLQKFLQSNPYKKAA